MGRQQKTEAHVPKRGAVCSTCCCAALATARSVRAASAPMRPLAWTFAADEGLGLVR